MDEQVRKLALQGEVIPAIKLQRQKHGGGLREAHDHVKSLRDGPIRS